MAGLTVCSVVVCGASASAESVRRALWLPRAPDLLRPLGEILPRLARPGLVAIVQRAGYVLVHGFSALTYHRSWVAFSADACRVLALRLADAYPATRWEIFEGGERVRLFDEEGGRDHGARRGYEPATRPGEAAAGRLRSLYRVFTEREVEADLVRDEALPVWLVGAETPSRVAPRNR